MLGKIDAISGPKRHAKFADSSTDRLDIAKTASGQSLQTDSDSRLCAFIAERVEPFSERDSSVRTLIAK